MKPEIVHNATRSAQTSRLFWAFCEPFLTSCETAAKQRGRIPRSALNTVWDWIRSDVLPDHFPPLENAVGQAIKRGSVRDIAKGIVRMKRMVEPVLRQTILLCDRDPVSSERLCKRLGSAHMMAHLRDIIDALAIEPVLAQLHSAFPEPLVDPDISQVEQMYEMLSDHIDKMPDCGDLMLAGAMKRFANQPHVMRIVHYAISSNAADDIEASDMGILSDLFVFDLKALSGDLIQSHKGLGWSSATNEVLHAYCKLADGIQREIAISETSRIGLVIRKLRAQFKDAFKDDFETAPSMVQALFDPVYQSDLTAGPDVKVLEQVIHLFDASVQLRPYAREVGLEAITKAYIAAASEIVNDASFSVIEVIRSQSGDGRVFALEYLNIVVDMTEKLEGKEAARIIRRLGEVASTAVQRNARTAAA